MKTDRELRKRLISFLTGCVFNILAVAGLYYLNIPSKNELFIIITCFYLMCYLSFIVFMIAVILNEKNNYSYFNFGWFFVGYSLPIALFYYGIPLIITLIKKYIDD